MTKEQEQEKYPFKIRFFGWLASLLIRFLFYTSKKRYTGLHHLEKYLDSDQPIIIVSWHNRNILASFAYLAHRRKGRDFHPMASASKDGSIATEAMKHMGVECVRGSSSRGGTQALRAMLRLARKGKDLGITPDGPRGPRYHVQEGVITTARLTGCPLIPVAYQAKRKKILNSWDKMIVPFPFNSLHYVYGEPICIPPKVTEEEHEEWRQKLEQEMMRVVEISEDFS